MLIVSEDKDNIFLTGIPISRLNKINKRIENAIEIKARDSVRISNVRSHNQPTTPNDNPTTNLQTSKDSLLNVDNDKDVSSSLSNDRDVSTSSQHDVGSHIDVSPRHSERSEREESINNINFQTAKTKEVNEYLYKRLENILNKEIQNQEGFIAKISKNSIHKMTSDKAIQKSIDNGFSREEHLKAVENIKSIFENSILRESREDINKNTDLTIHRLISKISNDSIALLTVKESKSHGNNLYTVELQLYPNSTSLSMPTNTKTELGSQISLQETEGRTLKSESPIEKTEPNPNTNLQTKPKSDKELIQAIKNKGEIRLLTYEKEKELRQLAQSQELLEAQYRHKMQDKINNIRNHFSSLRNVIENDIESGNIVTTPSILKQIADDAELREKIKQNVRDGREKYANTDSIILQDISHNGEIYRSGFDKNHVFFISKAEKQTTPQNYDELKAFRQKQEADFEFLKNQYEKILDDRLKRNGNLIENKDASTNVENESAPLGNSDLDSVDSTHLQKDVKDSLGEHDKDSSLNAQNDKENAHNDTLRHSEPLGEESKSETSLSNKKDSSDLRPQNDVGNVQNDKAKNKENIAMSEGEIEKPKGKKELNLDDLPQDLKDSWIKNFGLKSIDEDFVPNFAPDVAEALKKAGIGDIHLKIGSLIKLNKRQRNEFLPYIKTTIEEPNAIVDNGIGILFLKEFIGKDKTRYFMSVAKNYDGEWIFSTHTRKEKSFIEKMLKEHNIIYNKGFKGGEVAGASDILESGGTTIKPSDLQITYPANHSSGKNPKLDSTTNPQTNLTKAQAKKQEVLAKKQYKQELSDLKKKLLSAKKDAISFRDKEYDSNVGAGGATVKSSKKGGYVKPLPQDKLSKEKRYRQSLEYFSRENNISYILVDEYIDALNNKQSKEVLEKILQKIHESQKENERALKELQAEADKDIQDFKKSLSNKSIDEIENIYENYKNKHIFDMTQEEKEHRHIVRDALLRLPHTYDINVANILRVLKGKFLDFKDSDYLLSKDKADAAILQRDRNTIQKHFGINVLRDFGTNYAEFVRDGRGAIQKILLEAKDYEERAKAGKLSDFEISQGQYKGQVAGAFHREDLGDIDLVWGEVTNAEKQKGFGLVHILDKHPDLDLYKIPEIIENGKIKKTYNGYNIILDDYIVGINKGFKDKKGNILGDNLWIVSSFDVRNKKGD